MEGDPVTYQLAIYNGYHWSRDGVRASCLLQLQVGCAVFFRLYQQDPTSHA